MPLLLGNIKRVLFEDHSIGRSNEYLNILNGFMVNIEGTFRIYHYLQAAYPRVTLLTDSFYFQEHITLKEVLRLQLYT